MLPCFLYLLSLVPYCSTAYLHWEGEFNNFLLLPLCYANFCLYIYALISLHASSAFLFSPRFVLLSSHCSLPVSHQICWCRRLLANLSQLHRPDFAQVPSILY